ncbi:MAG: type 1 glutamine amidotransferase domain-containing protein [Planctomycetota bacterium]
MLNSFALLWIGLLGGLLAVGASVAAADDAPRVVIVLTNESSMGEGGRATGFYLSEASHPWRAFTEAGYEVVFASPLGGLAPIDPTSLDRSDATNAAFLGEVADGDAVATEALGELDAGEIDGVFFAGGHGTMWDFPDDPAVKSQTAAVYEAGGVVAAVCHGPAALVNVRLSNGSYLVDGKMVATFTNAEEDAVGLTGTVPFLLQTLLEERGAEVVEAANFESNVVVDGRLVTGQNPASARGTADAVVALISQAWR